MTATATTYEFRVAGHLDQHWSGWLGDLTITRHDDGTTALTGCVADQAQLHGTLAAIRDLGATLLSVQTTHGERRADQPEQAPVLKQTLRSERLTLRPASATDAEATWNYRRLHEVGHWLTETPTELEPYRATFTDPTRLATTVVVELDGALIGDFMLRVENAWSQTEVAEQARGTQAELGWVLDPAATGHGYATEAVRALIGYCFEQLGVRRVVANCFLDNVASWRLMERVGMRKELHAVRESLHRSGQWLDTLGYAVLAEEWVGSVGRTGTTDLSP